MRLLAWIKKEKHTTSSKLLVKGPKHKHSLAFRAPSIEQRWLGRMCAACRNPKRKPMIFKIYVVCWSMCHALMTIKFICPRYCAHLWRSLLYYWSNCEMIFILLKCGALYSFKSKIALGNYKMSIKYFILCHAERISIYWLKLFVYFVIFTTPPLYFWLESLRFPKQFSFPRDLLRIKTRVY